MITCVKSIEIFSTMTTYILCGWMQYFVVTIHLVIPDSSPMITLPHTSFILLWPHSVIKDNIAARISRQMSSAQCLQSKMYIFFSCTGKSRNLHMFVSFIPIKLVCGVVSCSPRNKLFWCAKLSNNLQINLQKWEVHWNVWTLVFCTSIYWFNKPLNTGYLSEMGFQFT